MSSLDEITKRILEKKKDNEQKRLDFLTKEYPPLSEKWAIRVWELRLQHPDMSDDEWLLGFWGKDIIKHSHEDDDSYNAFLMLKEKIRKEGV